MKPEQVVLERNSVEVVARRLIVLEKTPNVKRRWRAQLYRSVTNHCRAVFIG